MQNLDWNVSTSAISFFEKVLEGHSKIVKIIDRDYAYYTVCLINRQEINVLLVDEYVLGLATVLKARAEFPDMDYIVTSANWNGYTMEAKQYGWENDLGVFNLGEFLGALHLDYPVTYHRTDKDGNPVYSFK